MKILIGADLVPTKKNIYWFNICDKKILLGNELARRMDEFDYIILNLEAPITDKITPISKCGPNLNIPESSVEGIKSINPFFFTLANNHIMDQGIQGLEKTINILNKHKIGYAGIGMNIANMKHSFIKKLGNFYLGIYCCTEHEFSIATENMPGANPYDPLESFDHVQNLKKKCDYVIVLYHGGKEFYRYPSPKLQKVFHKFADKGADLVISQHTHCIGCKEEYNGSTLVYGQGNFLFNSGYDEYRNTGLLLVIDTQNISSINFLPIMQTEKGVRIATDNEKKKIIEEFNQRSECIKHPRFIIENYNDFAENKLAEYIVCLAGNNIFLRIIRKILGNRIIINLFNKKNFVRIINFLECEAHNELLLQGLKYENNNGGIK